MNRAIYLLGIVIVFVSITIFPSCDRVGLDILEEPQVVAITEDSIFADIEYTQRLLWESYQTLPYSIMSRRAKSDGNNTPLGDNILEDITDLAHNIMIWGGAAAIYYDGTYSASVQQSSGGQSVYNFNHPAKWKAFRNCYLLIENIDRVPNADEETKKRLTAEARMIIALQYFDMYRNLGGVPWVGKAFELGEDFNIGDKGSSESFQLPRLTAAASLDSIVKYIELAEPDLPWAIPADEKAQWDGRFTRGAAVGLKVRALLFGASPLFNSDTPYKEGDAADAKLTWYGGEDRSRWQDVIEACDEFMKGNAGGDYSLVQAEGTTCEDYRSAFQKAYFNRESSEVLISVRPDYRGTLIWGGDYSNHSYHAIMGFGAGVPTDNFLRLFPMSDGTPITDPASGWDENVDPFGLEGFAPGSPDNRKYNRDPRLYESALLNGDNRGSNRSGGWWQSYSGEHVDGLNNGSSVGSNFINNGGAHGRKYYPDGWANNNRINDHWCYLRLPEIYLAYAEALAEVGRDVDAKYYLDIVRARVGLKGIDDAYEPDLSGQALIDEIIDERARELAYEDVRWYDITRRKIEEAFTGEIKNVYVFAENGSTSPKVHPTQFSYEYRPIVTNQRAWKTAFDTKYYLQAFPLNEINKQYGLVQNPGY
ncbi:RagB/SusD family nutrient uptake outer membrane protein [Labilibacter sediminis]|nr:RagB/SusD family nutrient uptake outer membrane protein [Labilibacter sediminis]